LSAVVSDVIELAVHTPVDAEPKAVAPNVSVPSNVPLDASLTFVGGVLVLIAIVPELSNAAMALAAAFRAAVAILKLLAMFDLFYCRFDPIPFALINKGG